MSDVDSVLAGLGYRSSNPGGEWLEDERTYAASFPSNRGRGKLTAHLGMWSPVFADVPVLAALPGARGEEKTRNDDEALRAILRKAESEGWNPQPVLVWVAWNGEAFIAEGNHTTAAAAARGEARIAVDIRYFAGGELADGPMNPIRLVDAGVLHVELPSPPAPAP